VYLIWTSVFYRHVAKLDSSSYVFSLIVIFALLYAASFRRIAFARPVFRKSLFLLSLPKVLLYTIGGFVYFLPSILGGTNFRVFQGNQWDHFTYLSMANSALKYNFPTLFNASTNGLYIDDPTTFISNYYLLSRPVGPIAFAGIMKIFSWNLFTGANAFLMVVFLLQFLVTILIYRETVAKKNFGINTLQLVILLCLFLGFWGQYIFDFNSWGSLASISLYSLMILWMFLLKTSTSSVKLMLICSGLTFFAAFSLYPEGLSVWGGVLLFFFLVYFRTYPHKIRIYLPLTLLSVFFLTQFIGFNNLTYFLNQLRMGSSGVTDDWHTYWQAYLFGSSGYGDLSLVNALRTIPMGLLGLYFITPKSINFANTIEATFFVGNLFILLAIGIVFFANAKKLLKLIYFRIMIVLFLYILVLSKYTTIWSAGKAITYSLPILALFLLESTASLNARNIKRKMASRFSATKVFLLVLIVWTFFQFSFAITRISNSIEIGYSHSSKSYIGVQDVGLKSGQDWSISKIDAIPMCSSYKLDVKEPFQRYYLQLILSNSKIDWFDINENNSYFGNGIMIGFMKPVNDYKCVIQNEDFDGVKKFTIKPRNY
jgi:hypothetical protein